MSRQYIAPLDGVRALAILLVLIAHSAADYAAFGLRPTLARYGSPGVEIFFVLSGFLITGILLNTKERTHYFRNFFARRGLRIWPLYYVVVGAVIVSGLVHRHGVSWWPYLLYVSNLVYGHRVQPAPFGPLWSLAVEEQFYLLWPLVVWALSRQRLKTVCIAALVIVPILRLTLPLDSHNTLFQIDALLLGALMACCETSLQRWRPIAWAAVWLLPIGISWQTSQVVGAGALLVLALQSGSVPAKVLANPVLRYIGRISYGIYITHAIIFQAMARTPLHSRVLASADPAAVVGYSLLNILLAIALASASYYIFERPILSLKRYFETEPASAARRGIKSEIGEPVAT